MNAVCLLCEHIPACLSGGYCQKGYQNVTHPTCRWCGKAPHGGEWCPLVKAIVYGRDVEGATFIERVEFHSPQPIAPVNLKGEAWLTWRDDPHGRPITPEDTKT